MGNPRNVKNNPHAFAEDVVTDVKDIEINPIEKSIVLEGCKHTDISFLNQLAINDGFTSWEDMKTFF